MSFIISILLIIPLIIEGLGILLDRSPISYFYFFLPFCLSIFFIIKRKTVRFPVLATLCFTFFLIFSLISSLNFSADKQVSFEWWLFYLTGFLIFVFFYNYKTEAKNIFKFVIYVTSFIFISCFFIKNLLPNFFLIQHIPIREFNLFFSFYTYNHNLLGDFLGFILLLIVDKLKNNQNKLFLSLFFILFIIFLYSFSRSAYLALFCSMIIFVIFSRQKKNQVAISGRMIVILSTLFILVGTFFILITSSFNSLLQLPKKELFDSRDSYFYQGMAAFKEKPLFGLGMGNFAYASRKYLKNYYSFSDTSHNIIIDMLVENGLLATMFFIFFLLLVLRSVFRNKTLLSVMFLYLLIVFQTDYIFRMYSILGFFFILAGSVYEEKKELENTTIFGLMAFFLYIILQIILVSTIFIRSNRFELAVRIYPLNKSAYPPFINERIQKDDVVGAVITANQYEKIAPDDETVVRMLAETYLSLGDKKKALFYFEKAYTFNHFANLYYIQKLYYLKKDLYGKQKAEEFLVQAVNIYKELPHITDSQLDQIRSFCASEQISGCRFKYFYEPKPNELRHPNPQIPFSTVTNKMNNDGLNSSQNFSIEKPKGVFRIMALGGSETYGIYVNTQDNWPEQLEKLLNQKQLCPNINKFEVLNLAVDGDDLSYSIERYKLRGEKYNPDLIVLFVPNLYQLNEPLLQKISIYDQERNNNKAYTQEVAKGNLYPAWTLAMQDLSKEMDGQSVLKQQSGYLNDLYNTYKRPVLLVGYDYLSINDQEFFQGTLKNQPNSSIFLIYNVQGNKKYQLPDGNLNSEGYRAVAKQLYDGITQDINVCHVQ